ncbi:MAG TPA: HAMP domain-containing sensor histidine kinase [Candidatus Dormibacteraeota bacterium]|jgi:signal transduction histidine kinase|nr:HAMP domain-containing sensor histidine kinase [Candidatus Dormibacteraeota bacterium]
MPIRLRIALFGSLVVALTVLVFGTLVYFLVQRNLYTGQDASLTRRVTSGPFFGRGPGRGTIVVGPDGTVQRVDLPIDLRTSSDTYVELLSPTGAPLISSGEIDGQAPKVATDVLNQVPANSTLLATVEPANGVPVRMAVRKVGPGDPSGAGFVLVGQPMVPVVNQLLGLRLVLIIAAVFSILMALVASWLVAGRALRPVDRIAETAEEIGRTRDLSRRLPASNANDEVSRLSTRFNDMLGQLEQAYSLLEESLAAQKRFVADASHELRTPLTTIISNAGLLLNRPNVRAEDQRDAIEDIAAEGDRMSRLVQELLTLARADSGQHLEMAPVDLTSIVADVCRQARKLSEGRTIAFDGGQRLGLKGNEDALRQLMWILVDNGIKHARSDGRVEVTTRLVDGLARLTVSDNGQGIAPDALERIFERFYRPDEARSGEGAGLGLAIARWIAEEHGGTVSAANNPAGGATFTVDIPAAGEIEEPVAAAAS